MDYVNPSNVSKSVVTLSGDHILPVPPLLIQGIALKLCPAVEEYAIWI